MLKRRVVVLARAGHLACIVSCAFFIVLVLAACSSPAAKPVTVKPAATPTVQSSGRGVGDTLRFLNPEAPTILNPHLTTAIKDREPSRIVYEPLATFDKNGKLVPFLAAEIPTLQNGGVAADGKSVTWKLKPNIKWSDGTLFSAEDVLFTYKFVSNPDVKASTAGIYRVIEGVQVVDALTVKINFKNVNPAWALPFVGIQGAILPRHIFEAYNNANALKAPANTLPVGTGPYRVMSPGIKPQEVLLLGSQLVETNKTVFEPNPYFRDPDLPFFSRIEWRGGGTPSEAGRLVLQDGGTDYAYALGRLPVETLVQLEAAGRGEIVALFGAKVERIVLNRTDPNKETADGERSSLSFPHPFFSDKKVRQAFAYAIDREAIAKLYGPTGRPTTNNLVAPPQYASPNKFYEYDLEKAKALLDEAGWRDTNGDGIRDKNGVKMQVVFQAWISPAEQETQLIVEKALKSLGVEVKLKMVDSKPMFDPCSPSNPDSVDCFNADIMSQAIRSPNPDPSAYMLYWTCSQIPQKANKWSGLNDERWCSQDYDKLYQQSTTEMNPDVRAQLFVRMNDLQIEDVVMIPVVFMADAQGVGRTIEGVDLTPWDMNTWNIKDWRRISQ